MPTYAHKIFTTRKTQKIICLAEAYISIEVGPSPEDVSPVTKQTKLTFIRKSAHPSKQGLVPRLLRLLFLIQCLSIALKLLIN